MNYSDLGNGLFELGAALFSILNIKAMYTQKEVKGVHLAPTSFFMLWGFYNIFFYSFNDLWYSFVGGIFMTITNIIWISQMWYYKNIANKRYAEVKRRLFDLTPEYIEKKLEELVQFNNKILRNELE